MVRYRNGKKMLIKYTHFEVNGLKHAKPPECPFTLFALLLPAVRADTLAEVFICFKLCEESNIQCFGLKRYRFLSSVIR